MTIPESVTTIGDSAFYNCNSLPSVTVGSGVTSIGVDAFSYCYLTIVVCKATDVPNIVLYAFNDFSESHATLYVPKASLDEYKSTEPWSNFKQILPIEDGGEDPSNPDDEENGSATSVENTNAPSPMTNCQKIIRNGQLLILRDGKTYTIMGQVMKEK